MTSSLPNTSCRNQYYLTGSKRFFPLSKHHCFFLSWRMCPGSGRPPMFPYFTSFTVKARTNSKIETQVPFLLSLNLAFSAKGCSYHNCSLIWTAQWMFTKEYLKQEHNLLCAVSSFGISAGKNLVCGQDLTKDYRYLFSSVNAESVWEYAAYWRIKPQPAKGWFKTFWWSRSVIQKENGLKFSKLQAPLKVKDINS